MTPEEVIREFEDAGALMRGHFILSSGRRSDVYLNKSIVSMYPDRTERLCRALAEKVKASGAPPVDYVISPAMGAIIFGYETARWLKAPFMFLERANGGFALRRGFEIPKGARVLVVEDIVSTGLSAREAVEAVRQAGGEVLAVACLIDRSGGASDAGAELLSLAELSAPTYDPDDLPPHLQRIEPVKPGSRAAPGGGRAE